MSALWSTRSVAGALHVTFTAQIVTVTPKAGLLLITATLTPFVRPNCLFGADDAD
jgi:hypothetical protein